MLKRNILSLSLLALGTVLVFGCAQQTDTDSNVIDARDGVYSYQGTQSPGDAWSWTITPTYVIGTNETTGKYYAGSYTAYASGFNKMVVSESNDSGVPLDGTATAYFLEYPNTMLIVKPAGDDDNVIVCAARAVTAPPAGQYNFVNMPWAGWTSSDDAYGTVEVAVSAGSYTFNVRTYNLAGTLTHTTLEAGFTFSDGRLSKSGNPLQVFMTPSGVYLGDSGPGNGGFGGAAYQSVDVSEAGSKNYRGVLFVYDPLTGDGETMAIGAEPHPTLSNALAGFSYDDIETGARSTGGVTLEFGAQEVNGILTGTMDDGGPLSNFKIAVAQVSGKYIVLGIALDRYGDPQNFLVVEQ